MPETLGAYRRLHFYAGNCWRYATAPWRQRQIAPGDASTLFGSSFGDQGWNHLRRTLEEYDSNPAIDYRETTLYRFLRDFRPSSITQFLNEPSGELPLPLFVYPWGTFQRGETESGKDPWQSRFCGPSTEAFVADEFTRTIELYSRIRREGYRPWKLGNTFIGGTFLHGMDGKKRFIVLQGNHRMAILAHLGHQRIAVRDVPGWLDAVHERGLQLWPLVRDGRCSADHARRIFQFFFTNDGHHIYKLLEEAAVNGGL